MRTVVYMFQCTTRDKKNVVVRGRVVVAAQAFRLALPRRQAAVDAGVREVVSTHLRAVVEVMTLGEVFQQRGQLGDEARAACGPLLAKRGVAVESLDLRNIGMDEETFERFKVAKHAVNELRNNKDLDPETAKRLWAVGKAFFDPPDTAD